MRRKVIFTAAITLLFSLHIFAQAQFEFIEDQHDFGTINEGGSATWEFKFKNTGNEPILLQPTDVRASCGCTTPSWTKDTIKPGGTGSVSARFESAGKPLGAFTKNITVSHKGAVVKVLIIKGVIAKPDTTKYSDAVLKKSAHIDLEKNDHNFGKVERGQKVMTKINIKNTGKDSLTILSALAACNCITYKLIMEKKDKTTMDVKSIPPGKTYFLELVYFASTDGWNTDIITFTTNDKANPRVEVKLTAQVVASLQEKSPVMENKTTAPFGK